MAWHLRSIRRCSSASPTALEFAQRPIWPAPTGSAWPRPTRWAMPSCKSCCAVPINWWPCACPNSSVAACCWSRAEPSALGAAPVDQTELPGGQNQQAEQDAVPGKGHIAVVGNKLEQGAHRDHGEDKRGDEAHGKHRQIARL